MKIIIDTNIWISFVIGKRLLSLRKILTNKDIQIFVCPELLYEFLDVVSRPKFKNHIKKSDILATKELFDSYCEFVEIKRNAKSSIRDPKDLYLLSLAETVNADYIVTGDKDLLTLETHNSTKILNFNDFSELILN